MKFYKAHVRMDALDFSGSNISIWRRTFFRFDNNATNYTPDKVTYNMPDESFNSDYRAHGFIGDNTGVYNIHRDDAYFSGITLANGTSVYNISTDSGFTSVDDNSIATTSAIKDYVVNNTSNMNELSELEDVSFTNLQDNQLITSTGNTWENILNYKNSLTYNGSGETTLVTEGSIIEHLEDMSEKRDVFTGFEKYDDSKIEISQRTVSISPTGSSFNVYYNSKKITIDSTKNLQISTTEGKHYIYFDENGDLQELVNPSDIEAIDLVQGTRYGVYSAFVYWNNSDTESPYFGVEKHSVKRNNRFHIYQHITEGTRHESGAVIADYELNEDSETGITLSITPGYFWDEDQRFTFSDGVNDSDFKQQITPELVAPMLYKNGSVWSKFEESKYLFHTGGTGSVEYNSIDSGSLLGSQTEITGTGYTYTYITETNDPRHPIVLIQGQQVEFSSSEAENDALDNFTNLHTQGLPFQEIKVIWIIIGYADNTLTNSGNYTITKVLDVRDNKFNVLSGVRGASTSTASSVSTDINAFSGVLGGSDTNVQKALDTIDDNVYTKSDLDGGQLDNRYYTETEIDNNFVNVDGDTMTNKLTISAGGIDIVGGLTGDTITLNGYYVNEITNDITGNDDGFTLATTSAITSYVQNQIESFSTTLVGLDDTSITSEQDNQILQYNNSLNKWENRSDILIDGSLNVIGNLYVSGTTVTVNTEDLNIKDNIILINSGETGSGVTLVDAGIKIDRGSWEDYYFIFKEDSPMSEDSGTFRIGLSGSTQAVATRDDEGNMVDSGISYWDASSYLFKTNNNLIYDPINNLFTIGGNLNFDGKTITGLTTNISTGSDYELATTSSIVNYFTTETSDLISGVTLNGVFDETFTIVGSTGITTSVDGTNINIVNDNSVTYELLNVSNTNSGETIVIGKQGVDGSSIVDYYMSGLAGNQEGQIRILLNGSSSGYTREFQGDDISFDVDLLDSDGTSGSGEIKIKITNNSGNDLSMSYTFRNVGAI
jgi:hypothetical protein